MLDSDETIAAIASPPGHALRGIVRLSGPRAIEITQGLVAGTMGTPRPARPASFTTRLRIAATDRPVPAMLTHWPGPRTLTGQDLAEIHLVGANPLLQAVLSECLRRGARLARRGEFTLRAFLSGRLDLTQAEAVLGVIDARTPHQFRQALGQLAGGLGGTIQALRSRLLDVLAHIEAGLDFVDEADVDPIRRSQLADEIAVASRSVAEAAGRFQSRDREIGLPRVVLVGDPNAGKSRLFNALTGGENAIVSSQAGTTRDYLSARFQCADVWIELIDTAGLDATSDPIGMLAQQAREEVSQAADLVIECIPVDSFPACDRRSTDGRLVVCTKADLKPAPTGILGTSAITGEGLDDLRRAIAGSLDTAAADDAEVAGTSARCQAGLARTAEVLAETARAIEWGAGDELVAVDLRDAIEELGRVIGLVVTDDVLERIFERFCIGK